MSNMWLVGVSIHKPKRCNCRWHKSLYCCPIDKEGDYSLSIEQAQYNNVAEGYYYEDFPFTVGLSAYNSLWTYLLYKMTNMLLMMWIFAATKIQKNNSLIKSRRRWQREISVELYRIDKGFNQFFDFYGDTPNFYGGTDNFEENHITHNDGYVEDGFDEYPEEYVSQIISSLKNSKRPFYLYSLLLNKQFPLSNVAYDLLFDNNIGKIIANDARLSNTQKLKLFKKALYEYLAFSDEYDDTDIKRLASKRKYCMTEDLYLEQTKYSSYAIDMDNHIVVIWYQVVRELFPCLKLSKQFSSEITKLIQKKYIESICELFDYELYQEYGKRPIANIPEFSCPMITALYELFTQNQPIGRSAEAILANSFYNLSHGFALNYDRFIIEKAIKKYVDDIGDRYNPIENELIEYWDIL